MPKECDALQHKVAVRVEVAVCDEDVLVVFRPVALQVGARDAALTCTYGGRPHVHEGEPGTVWEG